MDTANAWRITGLNAGNLNSTLRFTGIEDLTGGASDDRFIFDDAMGVTGRIDGGGGANTLDYANYTTAISVTLQPSTGTVLSPATGTGGITGFDAVVGGKTTADSLTGANVSNTWTLGEPGAGDVNGFTFAGVERLTGGAIDDTLIASGGPSSWSITGTNAGVLNAVVRDLMSFAAFGTAVGVNLQTLLATTATGSIRFAKVEEVRGGSGADTLTGANTANSWTLTGADAGNVNGFRFVGVENINGGSLPDSFGFQDGAALSGKLAGRSGIDTLDHSQNTSGVTIDLAAGSATGVFGGAVGGIRGIDNALGGAGDDILKGNAGNNVLVGNGGRDSLDGGVGRDVLIGGTGADELIGGTWADILAAGTTDYDRNVAALNVILAEWSRTAGTNAGYSGRVAVIGSSSFSAPLTSQTVHDDGDADTLIGGTAERDWFFASHGDNPDSAPDRDALSELFTEIS